MIKSKSSIDALLPERVEKSPVDPSIQQLEKEDTCVRGDFSRKAEFGKQLDSGKDDKSTSVPFELYKRRTTVVIRRETFLDIVCDALAEYKYVGPNQRADLVLACRYRGTLWFFVEYYHTDDLELFIFSNFF